MPKVKRSKASKSSKTGKNPLTRGRIKKASSTISITDSEVSEQGTSFDSKSSHSSNSKPEMKAKFSPPPKPIEGVTNEREKKDDDDEEEFEMMDVNESEPRKANQVKQEKEERWEKLPSLVDCEFTGNKFPYLTKDVRFREFELHQRKELMRIKDEIEMLKDSTSSALRVTRSLCPETKFGKLSSAVQACGFPVKFKDLVLKVLSMETPLNTDPNMQPVRPEDLECNSILPMPMPLKALSAHKLQFPSPAKMAKYVTPTPKKEVFHFGASAKMTAPSTNKAPRLPKPGEVVYSRSGSPILQRRIMENGHGQVHERVKVVEPDGSELEVDVVFRGTHDPKKLRAFQELAKDFRNVAATRSTVKQNRIMPPRVITKAHSATKKKPEWR